MRNESKPDFLKTFWKTGLFVGKKKISKQLTRLLFLHLLMASMVSNPFSRPHAL